jgi:polysaccharide deacetylase family protein (PEP-CTERM system associated)
MTRTPPITNALSFDIEDWFHIVDVEHVADPNLWPTYPSLVMEQTQWILDTLAQASVRATFFVLGWVAQRHPKVVRMIADAGHELGTHSFWHRRVDQLSRQELHDDLKESIDVIEQNSGAKVLGFRAPSFSITPGSEWAFDVLHELGLKYDASLFPAARGHGGYPCHQEAHLFKKVPSGKPMLELPMSVLRAGPFRLPFSGGGYMRLLPKWVIRKSFDTFNRRRLPVVVYLHPRDFAPECPRVPMPLDRRFKCYVGLQTTRGKLQMLLERYQFDSCAAVLGLTPRQPAQQKSLTAATMDSV